jgi:cell division initiation protein
MVMEWTPADIQHKTFRNSWKGFNPKEVGIFLQEVAEEIHRLRIENAEQRKDLEDLEHELNEYKEREKAIRNVLLNAHKTAEQMKANAEKEAQLIVADAELKAEKIIQGAHERLSIEKENIAELKRQHIQLEVKLRATIEAFRRLLDNEKLEQGEIEPSTNAGE